MSDFAIMKWVKPLSAAYFLAFYLKFSESGFSFLFSPISYLFIYFALYFYLSLLSENSPSLNFLFPSNHLPIWLEKKKKDYEANQTKPYYMFQVVALWPIEKL